VNTCLLEEGVNNPLTSRVSGIRKIRAQELDIETFKVASVITEISSAHGYKKSASSNSNEVIHGPELISQHSKKGKKTIQSSEKLKSALQTLGARAHARNRNVESAHMRMMRDC
jgi:hypothetical protein